MQCIPFIGQPGPGKWKVPQQGTGCPEFHASQIRRGTKRLSSWLTGPAADSGLLEPRYGICAVDVDTAGDLSKEARRLRLCRLVLLPSPQGHAECWYRDGPGHARPGPHVPTCGLGARPRG